MRVSHTFRCCLKLPVAAVPRIKLGYVPSTIVNRNRKLVTLQQHTILPRNKQRKRRQCNQCKHQSEIHSTHSLEILYQTKRSRRTCNKNRVVSSLRGYYNPLRYSQLYGDKQFSSRPRECCDYEFGLRACYPLGNIVIERIYLIECSFFSCTGPRRGVRQLDTMTPSAQSGCN